MPHFQLRDPNSSDLVSQLSKQGSGSFYVKPTSKNEGITPIQGRATVDIMGKKVNIQLNHRIREEVDPEPSVPKWSYMIDLYSAYNPLTLIPDNNSKEFQMAYIFANAGTTTYSGSVSNLTATTKVGIGYSFTTGDLAKESVQHNSYKDQYNSDSDSMILCSFRMFYKKSTIDPDTGDIIIPTDDSTSQASVRSRLPCNVAISNVPSWITNIRIVFKIRWRQASDNDSGIALYNTWEEFRQAWEVMRVNTTDYTEVDFFCSVYGKVITYSGTTEQRGPHYISIQEIAGDEDKIWGAKPLHCSIGQLPGYKMIRLYYKKATSSEVSVPAADQISPGSAQINTNNHNLWFTGEACDVMGDDIGQDTITLNKLTCRGVGNDRGQDYINLDYSDDSKDRTEYVYVGSPFFLGFVEETNLYKDNVGINLYDNINALNFWHRCYFTGTAEKCTYDPEWLNPGQAAHLYQGSMVSLQDAGYTMLIPWAIKSGNSWKSPYEIPTAVNNEDLENNPHRILAVNWINKAEGNPALNKDTVKSTTDTEYGGGFSIKNGQINDGYYYGVINRGVTDVSGWKYNPVVLNTGASSNRLKNYLQYVAHLWDNNPTAFGSPSDLRNVTEILFVPLIVTGHKMCPNNPINNNSINAMCWGNSLIPSQYSNHQGYAEKIGLFPPTITGYY